jgi:hypothetical protein
VELGKRAKFGYNPGKHTLEDSLMSDSLRTYVSVKHRVYQNLREEHHNRVTNLALMITGVVRSRSVQQTQVAGEVPLRSQDKSFVQRQRRFLMNPGVEIDRFYSPFIRPFVWARRRHMLPLILDSSPAGCHCQMLMAACGYQSRALPLAWSARKGQKGHFPTTEHLKLVDRAAAHIPEDAPVVLLGDGEFGKVALAQEALSRNWCYVLRAACDDLIWIEGEPYSLSEFQVGPEETLWLEDVLWTNAQFGPVNVAVTWDKSKEAPMYLITCFELLGETLYWYERRFWVEPMFRDDKSMGFNLQKSQLRDPARMMRLLLVVCLSYLWIMFLGCMAVLSGSIRFIDRTDRRDCSLFTYGLRWLRRLLKIDAYIPVRFRPYPFLHLSQARGVG